MTVPGSRFTSREAPPATGPTVPQRPSSTAVPPGGDPERSSGWNHRIGTALSARPSPLFITTTVVLLFALHGARWWWIAYRRGHAVADLLNFGDSAHYTSIIQGGYRGILWAFYPLYPMVVRALAAVSWWSARADRPRATAGALKTFLLGLVGVVAFLLFERAASGSFLAFYSAQKAWTHTSSFRELVATAWLGNPWQSTNGDNLERYAFFWVCATSLWWLRRSPPLALYVALSLAALFLQGEFVNAFRFLAVVFPAFFVLGDTAARLPRRTVVLQLMVLAALAVLNLHTAGNYIRGNWAY